MKTINFTQEVIDKVCDADHCLHYDTDDKGHRARKELTLEDLERMNKLSKHYNENLS